MITQVVCPKQKFKDSKSIQTQLADLELLEAVTESGDW